MTNGNMVQRNIYIPIIISLLRLLWIRKQNSQMFVLWNFTTLLLHIIY